LTGSGWGKAWISEWQETHPSVEWTEGWYISALMYTLTGRACNLALAFRLWQDRQSLSLSAFVGAAAFVAVAFVVAAACPIATAHSSIAAMAHAMRPKPLTIRLDPCAICSFRPRRFAYNTPPL
jgi:hypothetical protein